jgi:NAD(P)-dependent dehydrogenase (short-subunit alcohol dehydrogenase family)
MSRRRLPVAGRVVAITGGARGIGRQTAAAFATAGAHVVIGDRELGLVEQAAKAIGCSARALHVDVADPLSLDRFVDDVELRTGPLDVMINNAGIMPIGEFIAETPLAAQRIMDVNVLGTVNGCRAAARRMLPRGRGHIVNVASVTGRAGLAGAVTYSASKHAVVGLSAALADELLQAGVRVSCVLPATVDTELAAGVVRPRGVRSVSADEVAAAIVDTVARPRAMVYVPARARVAANLAGHLSPVARGRLLRALGGDRSALDADPTARAAYEQRALGVPEEVKY